MSDSSEFDDVRREGIVLSTTAFILTKESILFFNKTRIRLGDIVFVGVKDNKSKVNIGRWIAIIVVSTLIFIYDLVRKGHVDETDLFVVPLVVTGITYFATLDCRQIELIVKTTSGKEYILATVDYQDISIEDVHHWCGIISATGVDWKQALPNRIYGGDVLKV